MQNLVCKMTDTRADTEQATDFQFDGQIKAEAVKHKRQALVAIQTKVSYSMSAC